MGSSSEADLVRSAIFVDLESLAVDGRHLIEIDLASITNAIEGQSSPVIKNAYADWSRFGILRQTFLDAGFIEVQASHLSSAKSGVDQQLTVDALESMVDQPEIEAVFLVSSDETFLPMVRALQRHGKKVVGLGWRQLTGDALRGTCDDFIDYEAIGPQEHREMVLRGPGRYRGGRPKRTPASDKSAGLSMDDPRDAGSPGETRGFEERSPEGPVARHELNHADPIIGLLVARNGPGYHPPGNRFVAAMTRIEPTFTLEDYGFENVTGFVNAHPMLSRQPERGRHFEVHLPKKISLRAVMAGRPFTTVEKMNEVLAAAPIGFLGVTRQTDVLETLHGIATGASEPFTRNQLVDQVVEKLEGFTRDEVAAVERLLWENKLYESVDRSAEIALEWSVRLKPTVSDIDDLMYLHDRELVLQGMLQGAYLRPEDWSVVFYGDATSGDEFLEMLQSLGFDYDAAGEGPVDEPVSSTTASEGEQEAVPDAVAEPVPEVEQEPDAEAEEPVEPEAQAEPETQLDAAIQDEPDEIEPEQSAEEPEPELAVEPEPAVDEVATEPPSEANGGEPADVDDPPEPARNYETVVTEPVGPKKGGWWNKQ